MPDIRLVQQNLFPILYSVSLDWVLLSNGTLDARAALASAVVVALGTDRLASVDDILPDIDSDDRRGWWADNDAEDIWEGWPIGTKLWLLKRTKITGPGATEGSLVVRIKQYILEALQPLLDKEIVSQIEVWANRDPVNRNRVDAAVILYRGPTREIEMRFQVLWDELQE